MTDRKIFVNLSSTDRSSGTNNDFIINFSNSALTSGMNGYFGGRSFINPIFFSLPNNWYNIQKDYNDTFYIAGIGGAGNPIEFGLKLQLTPGIYSTVAQLTTQIQTKINTALGTAGYTGLIAVSQLTTPTSDLNLLKIGFRFSGATATETLNLYFNVATPTLGFLNPYNFATVVGVDVNVIFLLPADTKPTFADFPPNLQVYDMIQIQCSLARTTYEIESGILSPSTILVSFPVGNFLVNNQVVFLNNNPMLYRQEMATTNWDTISIRVVDKNGRLIDFFGELDLSLIIENENNQTVGNTARLKDMNPYSANFI
jgi:hypothetical protein